MANIQAQNNIRYSIDNLVDSIEGLLLTKENSRLNFAGVSTVPSVDMDFSQPGKSKILIAFQIDSYNSYSNCWFYINSSGQPVFLSQSTLDIDALISNGNTPASLRSVDNFNVFAGKSVGIAIYLYTDDGVNSIPKISLAFNVTYSSQLLSTTKYSEAYKFENPVLVNSIVADKNENSGGTVSLTASAVKEDGTFINYTDPANLRGFRVSSVQFKADYYVPAIGSAYSRLNSVNFIYSQGSAVTSGVSSGEIVSITQNWFMNIQQVRMNIKHAKLINAKISAAVAFRTEPMRVSGEVIGYGSGARSVYNLANKSGIKYDTIKLYFDNQRVYSNYEFNTQAAHVICEAPDGVIVSCDYEYGWENETWLPMELSAIYELDDCERSEFRLILPDGQENKSVCAVKIILEMTEGRITRESIGKGKGVLTTYKLSHRVLDGNIQIFSNGSSLSNKNWYLTEDTQYVRIAAVNGAALTASYSWISETPEVYQMAAVFG